AGRDAGRRDGAGDLLHDGAADPAGDAAVGWRWLPAPLQVPRRWAHTVWGWAAARVREPARRRRRGASGASISVRSLAWKLSPKRKSRKLFAITKMSPMMW